MNKDITFRCNCGHGGFVCFDRDDSFYGKGSVLVEVIDKPKWLTYRIKKALAYIFKGGKLYHIDIILGPGDVNRLKKFLNKT